jgi:hypothetical protein
VNLPHGDDDRVAFPSLAPVPLHRGAICFWSACPVRKVTLGRQLARRLVKRFIDPIPNWKIGWRVDTDHF